MEEKKRGRWEREIDRKDGDREKGERAERY